MKPFDLKLALAGRPICTREGSEVLEIMTVSDKNILRTDQPVIALVKDGVSNEIITNTYSINGAYYDEDLGDSRYDLVMADTCKLKTKNITVVEYIDEYGCIVKCSEKRFNLLQTTLSQIKRTEIHRMQIEINV